MSWAVTLACRPETIQDPGAQRARLPDAPQTATTLLVASGVPLFDADVQPSGLTDGELDTLVHFDVRAALVRPTLRPRPRDGDALAVRWEAFLEQELPRLAARGLEPFALLGIPPDALPERGLEVAFHRLVPLLGRRRAVAVGPTGLGSGDPAEEHALRRHLEVAEETRRPIVIQLADRTTAAGLHRLVQLLDESGAEPGRVLIDGPGRRAFAVLRERGYRIALRPGPHRLSPADAAQLVNRHGSDGILLASGCGGGHGDLLAVPKVAAAMTDLGVPASAARRVGLENAAAFLHVEPTFWSPRR